MPCWMPYPKWSMDVVSPYAGAASRWFLCLIAAVLALAAAPLAGAAPAKPQIGTTVVVGEFRIVVDSFIPGGAARGFAPITVRAVNDSAKPESLAVSIRSGRSSDMAGSDQEVTLVVEGGETKVVERLVPIDRQYATTSLYVYLANGVERQTIRLPLADERVNSTARVIGFLGLNEVSEVQMAAFATALPMDGGETIHGAFGKGSRGGTGVQGAELFTVALDDMPRWTAGWSAVDTLFVDVSEELPADPRWQRVLEWARQGGQLVFVGMDLERRLKSIPGLAEMTTPRLLAAPSSKAWAIAGQLGGEFSAYHAGFGWIVQHQIDTEGPSFLVSSQTPPDDYGQWTGLLKVLDQLTELPAASPSLLHAVYRAGYESNPWYTGFADGGLPIRPVLAILTLFALLVGPGTVIYSRRKGRPGILLFAVPLLSVLTTGLIVSYGVLRQGFGTEGFAHSLTIVDQVQQQATVMLRRELILGRGGQTLQPLPSTTVFVPDEGGGGRVRAVEMDGNQLLLSGDFLPVRERTKHLVASATTTRAHLDWSPPNGTTMTVTNVLGVDLKQLFLRAPDGRIYSTEETISEGGTATLTFGGEPDLKRLFLFGLSDPIYRAAKLPRCGYIATASGAGPGVDDGSVEMKELYGFHGIVGYLDPASDQWGR
ncbi:MAG: hypothetical protein ACI80K_003772 [Paracoccaceae bacterium]|jgi:hypothetical protein